METYLFEGVCTALVTPFINGKVNYPLMRVLIKRQLDAGIKAIVVCGTTGEAPTLTDTEKIEIISQAKDTCGEECKVFAGTGSNSTQHAVKLSIDAQRAGADGLLIVSPYYNKATPEGLYAHYFTISKCVDLPIIVYNVPSRTGVDIPVSVYRKLSKLPNIAGVKEASSDIAKIARIKNACKPHFGIWTGNDDLTVPTLAVGGQGVISVASNVCPEQMVAMVSAAENGDFETAGDMQCAMQPLIDLMFCEVNPIPVKEAMAQIGYDCGPCRLPLCGLSKENKEKIKEYFAQ